MPGNTDDTAAVAELIEAAAPPARLGEFELLGKLGEGGMGEVWRARHHERIVALKLLSPRIAADAESRRRFIREAQAAGRVNHPRVVTCYSAGEIDGRVFMELQLMPGGDGLNLLRAHGGALRELRALELIKDCAEGLCALEAAGLVHRDIKPGNVFIDAEGRAKLGDLGLAREESGGDRITKTGLIVGTPAYMAPEQASGDVQLDTRADVWALGATLFHLLTGRPPFVGPTAMKIVSQVLSQEAPDPGTLVPELTPGTRTLVRRMLAREREDRFASASELVRALERALRGANAAHELGKRAVVRSPSGRRIISASDLPTLPPAHAKRSWLPWLAMGMAALAGVAAVGLARKEKERVARESAALPVPAAVKEHEPEPAPSAADVVLDVAAASHEEEAAPPEHHDAPFTGLVSSIARRDGGDAWHAGNDVFGFGPIDAPFARVTLVSSRPLSKQWGPKASAAMAYWRLSNLEVSRSVASGIPELKGEGFKDVRAGLFFELGLRSSAQPVASGRELTGQAVWLSLLVDQGNRAWVIPRAIDRRSSGPLTATSSGVWVRDPLSGFSFDPHRPLEVEVKIECGAKGARAYVGVKQGRDCRFQRMITDLPSGCLGLARGAYPWTHLGNWDGGRGTAQVQVGSWTQ